MRILRVALATAALCAGNAFFVADAVATPATPAVLAPEPTPTSIVRLQRTATDVRGGPDYGSGLRATGAVLVGVAVVAGIAYLLIRPRR